MFVARRCDFGDSLILNLSVRFFLWLSTFLEMRGGDNENASFLALRALDMELIRLERGLIDTFSLLLLFDRFCVFFCED